METEEPKPHSSDPSDLRDDGWFVRFLSDPGPDFIWVAIKDFFAVMGKGATNGAALDQIRARIVTLLADRETANFAPSDKHLYLLERNGRHAAGSPTDTDSSPGAANGRRWIWAAALHAGRASRNPEVEALKNELGKYPNGHCTCGGHERCLWCQLQRAEARIQDLEQQLHRNEFQGWEATPEGPYEVGDGGTEENKKVLDAVEETMTEQKCPKCQSPAPHLHPAVQHGGEVGVCPDAFHSAPTPENRELERVRAELMVTTAMGPEDFGGTDEGSHFMSQERFASARVTGGARGYVPFTLKGKTTPDKSTEPVESKYTDCRQPTERCGGCDVCLFGQGAELPESGSSEPSDDWLVKHWGGPLGPAMLAILRAFYKDAHNVGWVAGNKRGYRVGAARPESASALRSELRRAEGDLAKLRTWVVEQTDLPECDVCGGAGCSIDAHGTTTWCDKCAATGRQLMAIRRA
jgi:hypothetical protein